MQKRDEEDVFMDALIWSGYYAYAFGKAGLIVLAFLLALDCALHS